MFSSLFSPMLFSKSNNYLPTGISKPRFLLPIPGTCLFMCSIRQTSRFPNLNVPFLSFFIFPKLSISSSLSHSHTSILALSLTISQALFTHRLETDFNLFVCVVLQPKIVLMNLTLISITSFTLKDLLSDVAPVRLITRSFETFFVLSGLLSVEGNLVIAFTISFVIL